MALTAENLEKWTVESLKMFLLNRGVPLTGVIRKADLVTKCMLTDQLQLPVLSIVPEKVEEIQTRREKKLKDVYVQILFPEELTSGWFSDLCYYPDLTLDCLKDYVKRSVAEKDILFRHPNKNIDYDLKLKIDGKRIFLTNSVKYLGIHLDPHLHWKYHIHELSMKLSRATGMLSKIRHYVSYNTLISIYYAIFSSHMAYGCQIWGQKGNANRNKISILQNKILKRIHFKPNDETVNPLYHKSNILKFNDYVILQNFLFAYDHSHNTLPLSLKNIFIPVTNIHEHNTRNATQNFLSLPLTNTNKYGINSIKYQSISAWNMFVNKFHNLDISSLSKYQCKNQIKNYFINQYL